MISFLPLTSNRLDKILFSDLFTTGEVTSSNLSIDLDP